MPKRIPTMSITMTREGKRVTLKPGKLVELTTAEIKEIQAAAGKDALRTPHNEEVELQTQVIPGGITNLNDTAANPDASVPAPMGAATSPTTGGKKNPAPAKSGGKDDPKAGSDDEL